MKNITTFTAKQIEKAPNNLWINIVLFIQLNIEMYGKEEQKSPKDK